VITKPEEHDINRAGKRLLRELLEPLGWVINDVQEDYGIDYNVQVFDGRHPTGAWFHVQLKSSGSSSYSADNTFISQELSADHARHYALEIRDPVLVVHADVTSSHLYWYAPQLDGQLAKSVANPEAKSITIRIPTNQLLPGTAPDLLKTLNRIYLTLANRALTSASTNAFADSLKHFPNQDALFLAFQEKADTLRLQRVVVLYREGKLEEARPRAKAIIADPDASVEVKFWAEIQLEAIDYKETLHAGRPDSDLAKITLLHAKKLQQLTASGPNYLKFFALIARHAGELELLVYENSSLYMAQQQHLLRHGDPMMVLGLYAKRAVLTKRIISKYNQGLRLAGYAANYQDRWALGRALTRIVNGVGRYLITLHSEGNFDTEHSLGQSALQLCKLAAWIADETGDPEGIVLAIISALIITRSKDSDAYRWAEQTASSLPNADLRDDALLRLERAAKRWAGEKVAGDYHGDTVLQIIQNMAAAYGIDMSNDSNPFVRALRISAKDNSPERVLANCEHLLVSRGAIGPTAAKIQRLFNISTAGSKVIHCTLHNYHKDALEMDVAYEEFRRAHCDSCPDKKPRPDGWKYTGDVRRALEARNFGFVARLAGTEYGMRFTKDD
jgi:hypothetical protein